MMQTSVQAQFKILRSPDGRWLGIATLPTPAGPVQIAVSIKESTVNKQLIAGMMQQFKLAKARGASAGFLGGIFKKIGRIAKGAVSVVSNIARGRIAAALKSAVNLAREGLPVVALAIPGLGMITGPVMTAASSLLSRASKGDSKAKAALELNARQARAGDPAARRRAKILMAAALKQKAARRRAAAKRQPLGELSALSGQPLEIMGDTGPLGTWSTATNGEKVFTPAALAGGVMWDQLRPHLGYRSNQTSFITSRTAYHDGLQALSSIRRG
jgi:hypothetical protein